MRTAAKIFAYALAVLVLGCLLAPPLFWAGRALAEAGVLPILKKFAFPKYFNRSVLVAALVLAWPMLRWVGMRHVRDLGLESNPRFGKDLALGAGLGMAGLVLAGSAMMLVGRAAFVNDPNWLAVGGALLTAVVVALIEETFFRGALLGVLLKSWSWKPALAFLSVFFAALHFIRAPKKMPRIKNPDWLSGFQLLPKLFWQYGSLRLVLGGLVTLVLVGLVLGYTVVKTKSLAMAFGLHAGWVFSLRAFDVVTNNQGKPTFWFGRDLINGFGPVTMLVLTFGFVIWLLNKRSQAA